MGRLTKETNPLNHAASYTYDKVGNTLTAADKHETVTFTYDDLYRVTEVSSAAVVLAPAVPPAPRLPPSWSVL